MMEIQPLATILLTVVAGIFCLILAEKTKIPSILYLLIIGTLLGPEFANLIRPQIFRANFPHYISLMVALILFEGGASLRFAQFRDISATIRNLLSIGVIITLIGASLAAVFFTGMSLSKSVLFGAIMIVTGPTVVIPILQRLRIRENLHHILKWEAILIDPLGVVIAVVLFEFFIFEDVGIWRGLALFGGRIIWGMAMGLAAGGIMLAGMTKKWFLHAEGEELGGLFLLAVNLLFFGISEWGLTHSGLVASTTAGIFIGNRVFPFQRQVFHFKKQITLLALSVLFVLLSANVPVRAMQSIWKEGLFLLLILIFVVRPVAVYFSTLGDKKLAVREKLFLAFLAPRGIVSASLASLFAIAFEERALTVRGIFLPLSFYVIAGTILFYAVVSEFAAKVLGVHEEKGKGVVVVGANPLGLIFGEALKRKNIPVSFIDTNYSFCREARKRGFTAYGGSGFNKDFLESLDLKGIGYMLAATPNHEVNVLCSQSFGHYLERKSIFRLWDKTDKWEKVTSHAYDPSWGQPLLIAAGEAEPDIWEKVHEEKVQIASKKINEPLTVTPENLLRESLNLPLCAFNNDRMIVFTPNAVIPAASEVFYLTFP